MKTNIKLDKKKGNTKAQFKKARPRKAKSNPLPVILISLGGFILLIIVILVAAGNNKSSQNNQASNTHTSEQFGSGSKPQAEKKQVAPKVVKETKSTKPQTAASGPELVGYGANVIKPKDETEASTSVTETEESSAVSTPTESKSETTAPAAKLSPKEQSIANLKKIGEQYKIFAANRQGHMPLEFYQLELNENDKVSPLTNQPYVMTQQGKGAPLKDSEGLVIVREAQAVNGKYLCLIGNGEVKEIDAGNIEE